MRKRDLFAGGPEAFINGNGLTTADSISASIPSTKYSLGTLIFIPFTSGEEAA
jgi:hypothetical protein